MAESIRVFHPRSQKRSFSALSVYSSLERDTESNVLFKGTMNSEFEEMRLALQSEFKAPKGVIKIELDLAGDVIYAITISGDFFMHPEEALEKLERMLVGVKADRGSLLAAVQRFYSSTGVRTPMVEPEHWVEAILRAAGG